MMRELAVKADAAVAAAADGCDQAEKDAIAAEAAATEAETARDAVNGEWERLRLTLRH